MTEQATKNERILWTAFPSWKQFTWLYLFSGLAAFRGGLFWAFGLPTGEIWIVGALFLVGCVVLIRRWARYLITSTKVIIKNGYTGRDIDVIHLDQIREVTIQQGLVARIMGIGTLVIQALDREHRLRFRGIQDPEVLKARIDALRPGLPEAIGPSS